MQSIRKTGKTSRDRANGSPQKNASNKAARASWLNDGHKGDRFPSQSCNGGKNRQNGNGRRTRNAG